MTNHGLKPQMVGFPIGVAARHLFSELTTFAFPKQSTSWIVTLFVRRLGLPTEQTNCSVEKETVVPDHESRDHRSFDLALPTDFRSTYSYAAGASLRRTRSYAGRQVAAPSGLSEIAETSRRFFCRAWALSTRKPTMSFAHPAKRGE